MSKVPEFIKIGNTVRYIQEPYNVPSNDLTIEWIGANNNHVMIAGTRPNARQPGEYATGSDFSWGQGWELVPEVVYTVKEDVLARLADIATCAMGQTQYKLNKLIAQIRETE